MVERVRTTLHHHPLCCIILSVKFRGFLQMAVTGSDKKGDESMDSAGLKDINSLGYDVIATVYQMDAFKATIKFDTNGKILIIQDGSVICSFHAEKSGNDEGKVSAAFIQKKYEE